jgi:predicted ATPase
VQQQAETIITLATDHGFPQVLAWVAIMRGWSLAMQGNADEGISQMQEGLSAGPTLGLENLRAYRFGLLGEAYQKVGQLDESQTALAEAFAAIESIGPSFWQAELYRLKGELTLQKGARGWGLGTGSPPSQTPSLKPLVPGEVQQEAEGYFLKAIAIAQKQQAKSLELRAVMSLARLWQSQGKTSEARQRLAEIYGWFTEGFDTKDLQEAKALLGELSKR